MIYTYYPGCTLKTKAKDLDLYARKSATALGITLEEPEDWQCCGAVYPMAKDEIATKLSAVRTLVAARDKKSPLITVCSACHHVMVRVNDDMKCDADIRGKVNRYLELENAYAGETEVIHYLSMLRDKVGFDELKKKVVKPLTGKKIAAYYGCMLLRPSKVMQFDDPENPTILEDFIAAIGATPVVYPFRNECCGGYVTLSDKDLAKKSAGKVMASAKEMGAETIVTACPLCLYNLDANGGKDKLPVQYFTELLAEALDVK